MTDSDPVDGLRPGMRAVVRRRIEHGVTDALGDLVAMDADTVSVLTRRGLVVIDRAAVVAAKEVPPRPTRRGAPHLAISMHDLERIMVEGWPPLERAELGGWLLRAAAGFTGRANSVLPLGDPGVPLSDAVDRCESWYDERGLRRLFSLFGPAGFAVDDDPLGRELLGRDYEPINNTLVLTAAIATLPPEAPHDPGARVQLESSPSQPWWDAWAPAGRPSRRGRRRTRRGPDRDDELTGSAVCLARAGRCCHRRCTGCVRPCLGRSIGAARGAGSSTHRRRRAAHGRARGRVARTRHTVHVSAGDTGKLTGAEPL